MTTAENMFLYSFRTGAEMNAINWVRWIHITQGKTHCPTCLMLDECCFHKDQVPKSPQHFLCHCATEPMPYGEIVHQAQATAAYSKFDPYLFDPDHFYRHGKSQMLESWGYTISDSQWLQKEIENQGLEKYISGDYQLGVLNEFGQRISIRVKLPRKNGEGEISFITGWTVKPNGKIHLNTPFGGK